MYSTGEADIDIGKILDPLEFRILDLHDRGFSYREIAGVVSLSKSTIGDHIKKIRKKLNFISDKPL